MTRDERLAEFARYAVESEAESGVPAELTCAQWAVESGWGVHASGKNNLFGIKWVKSRHPHYEWCRTTECYSTQAGMDAAVASGAIRGAVKIPSSSMKICCSCEAAFASFDTPMDALRDRAALLTDPRGPYAKAWTAFCLNHNAEQLARDIAGTYATGPGYGALLVNIMRQNDVREACAAARQTTT